MPRGRSREHQVGEGVQGGSGDSGTSHKDTFHESADWLRAL